MAPSISVGLVLLNSPHTVAEEDAACLLQKTLLSQQDIVAVEDECRCPGYYQEECEDEFDQGCRWSDEGSSNGHWCQCLGPDVRQLPPVTASPGPCLDQGRYIRHDVGTAIYWEQCNVKYWVQSCDMCDGILDFAHTPCHNHWVDQPQSYIDSLLTGGGFPGADGERFQCSQHWAHTGLPVGVVDSAVPDRKCPLNHEDRLFRTPSSGSSDITIVDCYEQCLSTPGCNHFSYGAWEGAYVCMGCTESDEAHIHDGFTLYDMPTQ